MFKSIQVFWDKHSSEVTLFLMVVWVVLLIVGTIAEIFDIKWVLSWPIWQPPGKYK